MPLRTEMIVDSRDRRDNPLLSRVTGLCHPRFDKGRGAQQTVEMFCGALIAAGCSLLTTDTEADKMLRQTALMLGLSYQALPLTENGGYENFCDRERIERMTLFIPYKWPWQVEQGKLDLWPGLQAAILAGVHMRIIAMYYPHRMAMLVHAYSAREGGGVTLHCDAPDHSDQGIREFSMFLDGAWNALADHSIELMTQETEKEIHELEAGDSNGVASS